MRRITAHAAVAVIVGGLLSPVVALTTAPPASADGAGAVTTVVGGGRGFSGPASRALFTASNPHLDAAPDGSVLTTEDNRVLRIRPATDTVAVVPGATVASGDGPIVDVSAAGTSVLFATPSGIQRAASDGTTTRLLDRTGVRALDVGADGVVWVLTSSDVLRILPSGAVLSVTTAASQFGDAIDLTVAPDGSKAYVLDNGYGRYGIYQVTPGAVGARVAGNLQRDPDGLLAGSPLAQSTSEVRTLSTDGVDLMMAQPKWGRTLRFTIGGTGHWRNNLGWCGDGVVYRGTQLVVACHEPGYGNTYPSLRSVTVEGADLGRILGADPAQPWSPDGVLATDAYTDPVRGAAGLPDGRIVFTTEHGLVREVDSAGLLHTRASSLGWIGGRGKTAAGPDGTVYVVTDAGAVIKVPVSGAPVQLTIDAEATDVEVQSDGTLVVADARGHRLLRVPADGSNTTVLTDALGTPADIGLDGDTVLVADTGLRRVASDGTVTSVMTGGTPVTAARISDGIWTDPLIEDLTHRPQVLLPDGALTPIVAGLPWWTFTQVQGLGDGAVVVAGPTSVVRVSGDGLPTVAPFAITATPMPGRIDLGWDPTGTAKVVMIAKRGTVPPADRWDGVPLGDPHTVSRLGDALQAGDPWSFAAFALTAPGTWSAPATATASALEDTVAPMPPVNPAVTATRTSIALTWTNPVDPDLDHEVIRMALGTTPPATPDDGILVSSRAYSGMSVPGPVAGQDYALSLFDVDQHGNYSSWSAVSRLDLTPPAPVTDLQVTSGYSTATFSFTPPTDADYAGYRFRVVAGADTPPLPDGANATGTSRTVTGLARGTDFTLAVWAVDASGNAADPVVTHVSTLVDSGPPAVTDLAATGGDYQVTATWTPPTPTDADLATFNVRLTGATGTLLSNITLDKATDHYTWSGLPGGASYTVTMTATDTQGLVSPASTATAQTAADANGNPPQISPSDVTVTPSSPTTVQVSFPRPDIPDLKAVQAAVAPIGQDPRTHTTATALVIGTTTVSGTVTLPLAATSYQLVLFVVDLNGHVTQSVGPNIQGGASAAQLPAAPAGLTVNSPADNTVGLSWAVGALDSVRVTSWTVTASSGSLSRSLILTPSSRQAGFDDLAGGLDWTLSVHGNNAYGAGPSVSADPVAVADTTAPAQVTGATAVPSADTELLTWINPTAFDFDHVVLTRLGATTAETQVVYRGPGTSARATGLLAGHTYRFQIQAFDQLGNVDPVPVTLTSLQSALTLSGPALLGYGTPLTLTGALTWNGTHPAGRAVSIQAQAAGSTVWTPMVSATTTASGSFSAVIRPSVTLAYRAVFTGSGGMGGAYSATRSVAVTPVLSIQSNVTSLRLGGVVTISTTAAPRHPGGRILLQRWTGSGWSAVAWRTLSSTSTASVAVRPPSRGINTYRWVTPSDPSHAAGFGAMRQVRVS